MTAATISDKREIPVELQHIEFSGYAPDLPPLWHGSGDLVLRPFRCTDGIEIALTRSPDNNSSKNHAAKVAADYARLETFSHPHIVAAIDAGLGGRAGASIDRIGHGRSFNMLDKELALTI